MMNVMKIRTLAFVFAISLAASNVLAQDSSSMEGHDHMNHPTVGHTTEHGSTADHSSMGHEATGRHDAEGIGVINSVSKLNRMVNLTHEPIAALNWPEMTMDLPVAKSVDIGSLQSGDKVKFHLMLNEHKKYVITQIKK